MMLLCSSTLSDFGDELLGADRAESAVVHIGKGEALGALADNNVWPRAIIAELVPPVRRALGFDED